MAIDGLEKLETWQKSREYANLIYRMVIPLLPIDEKYNLVSQLKRAAVSIPANIAEGYERNHRKEYLHFLHIARGSLGEAETYLLLARDLDYVSEETYTLLEAQRAEAGRILRGLIKSLTEKLDP